MKIFLSLILNILIFQIYAIEINDFDSSPIAGTVEAPVAEPQNPQEINETEEVKEFAIQKKLLIDVSDIFYKVYIRCYYIDKNSRKASINYLWGRTPDNQYAVIKGSWYENTRLWNNVYYTEASDIELKQTCRNVLEFAGFSENDFNKIFVNYTAAMWSTSYDTNFWSDIRIPTFNGFSRIVVLGDSASDVHNMFDKMYWLLPNQEGYFHGRFSNGPVMVEYLAKILNLPLEVVAEGGAEIKGEGSQGFVAKSLLEQFQLYKGFIDNLPPGYTNDVNKTLFIVFIGGNDFNQQTDPTNDVSILINNYLFVINKLVDMGANHIIVPVFPDISLFPDVAARIKENYLGQKTLDLQIENFNKGIELGLEKFNDKTKYPNLHIYRPNFDDMINKSRLSGAFKNLTSKCSSAGYTNSPTINTVCSEPLDYFMWDGMHPSTKAHCMWANAIAEFLALQLGVQININANCEYNYVHVK
ncbi:MAG TPA: SGNH/GDSL hydrolase family protein [Burkholderiales bacterium]|nr:SGNH/GDSL hydrolase family protein [Burkholderiales bacterium]